MHRAFVWWQKEHRAIAVLIISSDKSYIMLLRSPVSVFFSKVPALLACSFCQTITILLREFQSSLGNLSLLSEAELCHSKISMLLWASTCNTVTLILCTVSQMSFHNSFLQTSLEYISQSSATYAGSQENRSLATDQESICKWHYPRPSCLNIK